jgi:hypothetical protein
MFCPGRSQIEKIIVGCELVNLQKSASFLLVQNSIQITAIKGQVTLAMEGRMNKSFTLTVDIL